MAGSRYGPDRLDRYRLAKGTQTAVARMIAKRKHIVIAIAAVVLAAAVVNTALVVEVRCDKGWICGQCGSRKYQTQWAWGSRSAPLVEVSALGKWLLTKSSEHTHDWRNIQGTGRSVFGRSIGSRHGLAPPILSMPAELLNRFVASASEPDLHEFVQVMCDGTAEEQETLIRRTCEKMLNSGG